MENFSKRSRNLSESFKPARDESIPTVNKHTNSYKASGCSAQVSTMQYHHVDLADENTVSGEAPQVPVASRKSGMQNLYCLLNM